MDGDESTRRPVEDESRRSLLIDEWAAKVRGRPEPEKPMRLAKRLGSIEIENVKTDAIQPLRSLWSEGPAVVIFIRHFG